MFKNDNLVEIQRILKIDSIEVSIFEYIQQYGQRLRACFYLEKTNPKRYRLDRRSERPYGQGEQCRLVDLKALEVVSDWITYKYLQYDFESMMNDQMNDQISKDSDAETE